MNGHWNSIAWIVWAPQDKTIGTASSDFTARLWDPKTGAEIAQLVHPDAVTSIGYRHDGRSVVTACLDGIVRIWNISAKDKPIQEINLGSQPVRAVSPSPRSRDIAAVVGDGIGPGGVVLIKDGKIAAQAPIELADRPNARWSPDGASLALACRGGLRVFTVQGKALTESWHYETPSVAECADWSPDGKRVCIGLESGKTIIVGVGSAGLSAEFVAHEELIWDMAWHSSTDEIVTIGNDGYVSVWSGSNLAAKTKLGPFSRGVSSAAWSPSGDVIVSSSADGRFCLWDVNRRRAKCDDVKAHDNWIRSIQFDLNGQRFLTASQDGSLGVWDANTGTVLRATMDLGIGPLWGAAWTPDGRIAAISETGFLCVVDLNNVTSIPQIRLEDGWLRGLAWSAEASLVVVGSGQKGTVFGIDSANLLSTRWKHECGSPCFSCAVSPDGRRVAVALADHTIRLLSASDGTEEAIFRGHESEVWSVAFAKDGKTLVSASADGSVRIWTAADRKTTHVFRLVTSCISVSMSSGGNVLFGSAGAWIVDPRKAGEEPGQEARTLTDSPVAILDGPAERDLLGREPLVEQLAFFLHRAAEHSRELAGTDRTPEGFMLHVGGQWGSGKTSLARQVVEQVRCSPRKMFRRRLTISGDVRHWDPVYVSSWAAAGLAPAWWSIAMAVRSKIVGERWFPRRWIFRFKEVIFRFPSLLKRLAGLMLITVALGVTYILWGQTWIRTVMKSIEPSATTGAAQLWREILSIIADGLGVGLPVIGVIVAVSMTVRRGRRRWKWPSRDSSGVDLDTEINFSDLPRRYLSWLRRCMGRDLLLVIDDLDRCSPEYVTDTLAALHIMATVDYRSHVAPVDVQRIPRRHGNALGILVVADRRWLEMAVAEHTALWRRAPEGAPKSGAAEFLEKIFIASFELPRLQAHQREALVESCVADAGRANVDQGIRPARGGTSTAEAEAEQLKQIAADIEGLSRPNPTVVASIKSRITSLRPKNQDHMHAALIRRMNRPGYQRAQETQLLYEYAKYMDRTPRGVKRTLVSFWLNWTVVLLLRFSKLPSAESVMRWTIVALRWPSVANTVSNENRGAWIEGARGALGSEFAEFVEIADNEEVALVGATLRS